MYVWKKTDLVTQTCSGGLEDRLGLLILIDTAQLNLNLTQLELECLGIGLDHRTHPTPPMKLCVVVVVEPLTMEMFQASTNTCTI